MSEQAGSDNISELPALKDADVARMLMGCASEVCAGLGVTMRFDVQIADENAKDPVAVQNAIKRTLMVLSHIVVRTGLTRETIQAMNPNSGQA